MNEEIKNMYAALGIQPDVLAFGENILKNLENRFQEIDTVAEYNQLKVLKAMQDHKVSDIHFAATSGYGYNDMGRDTLRRCMHLRFMRRRHRCVPRSPAAPCAGHCAARQSLPGMSC